ncbi:MAG: hypothetical protein ACRCXZ_00585 [Patescibacteria group bacterium]
MAKHYTLLSPDKRSIIEISDLGGQVLSYRINGKKIFHENPFNLKRCGMQILFPYAGPLNDGVFSLAHTKLPQHGFGRDVQWQIYQMIEKEEYNVITFALSHSDLPEIWQNSYPFPFITMIHYYLSNDGLDVDLVVMNPLQEDMQVPVRPGLHPYFSARIEDKKNLKISQDQSLYNKLDWTKPNDSLFLTPKKNNSLSFELGDFKYKSSIKERIFRLSSEEKEIELELNNKYVVWAEANTEYICIEPISGPFNSINYNPVLIQKGQGYQFRYKIEIKENKKIATHSS